jgi:hypothetical protein
MSKLNTLFKSLKQANEVLGALESAGIDVDRLVHISNAQGPQAKIIHNILSLATSLTDGVQDVSPAEKKLLAPPPKRKPKPKKG